MEGYQIIDPIGDLAQKPETYRPLDHNDRCEFSGCDTRLSIYTEYNICALHRRILSMSNDDVRTVRLVITTKDGKYQGSPILLEEDDISIAIVNEEDNVLWSAKL